MKFKDGDRISNIGSTKPLVGVVYIFDCIYYKKSYKIIWDGGYTSYPPIAVVDKYCELDNQYYRNKKLKELGVR